MSKRNPDSTTKRHGDAWEKVAQLSDAQLFQVYDWAQALTYSRAIALMQAEFKLAEDKLPSISKFGDWFHYFTPIMKKHRFEQAVTTGVEVREMAEKCGDVSEPLTNLLENAASAAVLAKDPGMIKLLVSLALEARGKLTDAQKYRAAMQTKIEAGLDAVADLAKGNEEALKLYQAFRAELQKAVAA